MAALRSASARSAAVYAGYAQSARAVEWPRLFTQLQRIVATRRVQHSMNDHELSASLVTRAASLSTRSRRVTPIVDRIGAGDAFAAGVLHGLFSGMDEQASLEFGLAAGCLKHSVPGDFLRLSAAEVSRFLDDGRFDVRR
jgi:2-dehydro-3-deoxygluconokinase